MKKVACLPSTSVLLVLTLEHNSQAFDSYSLVRMRVCDPDNASKVLSISGEL